MGRVPAAVLRAANGLVNAVIAVVLIGLFALGCYALWDSSQLDAQASATTWLPYKPTEPEPLSFWELQEINPEVVAWVSVYGTGMDYPVCQSDDEWKYLTTDAKGDPSPSGALFMDAAADPGFRDAVTFIYGHHMEHDVMFGQVTDFLDAAFFEEHRFGKLHANGRDQGLEFFACLRTDAYDASVYRRTFADDADRQAWLDQMRARADCTRNVNVGVDERVVALSTCSSEQTNGRTVLLARVTQKVEDDPFTTWPNTGTGVDGQMGWLGIAWYGWVAIACAIGLGVALAWDRRRKRRAKAEMAAEPGEAVPTEAKADAEDGS